MKKQKAKSARRRTGLNEQRRGQPSKPGAREGKHQFFGFLDGIEALVRSDLERRGFPSDLIKLADHCFAFRPHKKMGAKEGKLLRRKYERTVARHLPADRMLKQRDEWSFNILRLAHDVRAAIANRDPEQAALMGLFLGIGVENLHASETSSDRGRRDRRPKGIIHAIQQETEEHGPESPKWLWQHFKQRHTDLKNGISIDEPDFSGEVFLEDGRLVQQPADESCSRQAKIGYDRFEVYYYEIFRSLTPA